MLHDIINVYHARKARKAGVDGLVLVCTGGHGGILNPFVLISEVKQFFTMKMPLFRAL